MHTVELYEEVTCSQVMNTTTNMEKECNARLLINAHRYLMISKSWCPDCHYVYNIWDSFGLRDKVHIIELDKFEDQNEAVRLEAKFTAISGRKWVPTIFFNGRMLGTEADLKAWQLDGTLKQRFISEGII